MSGSVSILYGAAVTPVDASTWKAMPRCLLAVGPTGDIEWLFEHIEEDRLTEVLGQKGHSTAEVVTLQKGEFLIPGFIDTHTVRQSY